MLSFSSACPRFCAERPLGCAVGLIRFKANSSPNYSIQYFQMDADVQASRGVEAASGTAIEV